MFERYTDRGRRVIFFARKEASDLGDIEIKPIHLLLGLLREGKALFARLQAPEDKLEALHKACVKQGLGKEHLPTSVDMPMDSGTRGVLQRATSEADNRKDKEIDVEHLLLGLLHVPSKAKEILGEQGFTHGQVRARLGGDNSPLGETLDYT